MFNSFFSHHKFYYTYAVPEEVDFELSQAINDLKSSQFQQMNYRNNQKEYIDNIYSVKQVPLLQKLILDYTGQIEQDTKYGGIILEQFIKLTINQVKSIEWVFQDVWMNHDQPQNFIHEYKGVYSWVLWYDKSDIKKVHIFPSFSDQGVFPFYSNDKENIVFSGSVAVALK